MCAHNVISNSVEPVEDLKLKKVSVDDTAQGKRKSKILFFIVPMAVLCFGLYWQTRTKSEQEVVLAMKEAQSENVSLCVPPAILEFPEDLFTQEQRRSGLVAVHVLVTAYLCLVLALVCDQYFVPTLEILAESLNIPVDVAGATFMAIGTSSPELYSAIIGSFVTKGDIGIGTIVGSAVFNILGVTSVTGIILWNQESSIDWFPITRDSLVYVSSVSALICILMDNVVTRLEATILLLMFIVYIVVMYFNSSIREWGEGTLDDLHRWWKKTRRARALSMGRHRALSFKSGRMGDPKLMPDSDFPDDRSSDTTSSSDASDLDDDMSPWSIPQDSLIQKALWVVSWPALLLLTITIPPCKGKSKGNFVLTFACSVIWIGIISYLCSWMVTVISHTFGLPDSVAGITILAAGISVPEVIASIIVVNSGLANMAICNLIGSNIFDILFCLGVPWLVKTTLSPTGMLRINSSALAYTTLTLLSTVVLMFLTFSTAGWKLNRRVGFVCLGLYAGFLVVACLCEMNYFGDMNPPSCTS